MLVDSVFNINNINQWSNILRTTFELSFKSHIRIYKHMSKVIFKDTAMEDDKYDLVGTPSTSGSSPNKWEYSTQDNTNFHLPLLNGYMDTTNGYIPNLVVSHPMMPLQNVATNLYNINVCQASNFYYMGELFPQTFNRQYCQTGREEYIREVVQTNDQRLLSLRNWENINNGKRSNKPGFIFTLMCYNVLAQDLLIQHPYLYHRHNNESLEWKVRWRNLFNEITKFKPDILCLQEVQESHIDNYFSVLESIGYSSLYKRRTGDKIDGCALYYKTDLIQLVEHTSVEYFQPDVPILNRDNVGLIAVFAPKLHPTRKFVVATTHILYNPRRQDVKLAQMQLLLAEIERLSYVKEGKYLPVILTGDLNSSPDSPVYEFVTKGRLRYENLAVRSLKKDPKLLQVTGKLLIPAKLRITDNCQHADLLERRSKNEKPSRNEEMSIIKLYHSSKSQSEKSTTKEANPDDTRLFATGILSHNFAFKSVYSDDGPEYNLGTTYQGQWLTVDYIFYSIKKDEDSEDKLKLLSRYRLPSKEELLGINIPNSVVGSDHLSLLAKFKLEY